MVTPRLSLHGKPAAAADPSRLAAFVFILILTVSSLCGIALSASSSEDGLSAEAKEARLQAEEILSKPIFRQPDERVGLAARIGRWILGVLRWLGRLISRMGGVLGLSTPVSIAVSVAVILFAVGLIIYFILKTRWSTRSSTHLVAELEPEKPPEAPRDLSAVEEALRSGDLARVAGLLTSWFLTRAYEPERPPEGWTNRELLPDLRTRPPLRGGDWERLVGWHEALRYAGSPPDRSVLEAWVERARGSVP
jgi:hypothetical protein